MQVVFDWMDRVLNWILALLMAAIVAVIAAQVWYRYVLDAPLSWSAELGRYLFVWISFLGAAAGVRYQVHLGIDLLPKLLPETGCRLVIVVGNLIVQIFLLVIIFWGFKLLRIVYLESSPAMNIPMLYPYLAVPVGSIFMFINSLRISFAVVTGGVLKREMRF